MLSIVLAFFLGVFLAPAIRPLFRPIMVEFIRAGIILGDEVRRVSHTVREGVEDAQAEASAARSRRPPSSGDEAAASGNAAASGDAAASGTGDGDGTSSSSKKADDSA